MKLKILLPFCLLLLSEALIGQNKDSQIKRMGNQFEYEDCDCVEIDLEIHNGLYGAYGGQTILDADETTKGAVTIANLNDTDGDGIIDNMDNSVIASAMGRNEVDLMKLRITSNGIIPVKCPNLKLTFPNKVKLWSTSNKITPVNSVISLSSLPKVVWVEVIAVSNSIRDISISAELNEVLEGTGDTVSVTSIWVDKKSVFTPNGNRVNIPIPASLGIDNPEMLSYINNETTAADGSLYGFGTYKPILGTLPLADGWFGGRILFEFELKPLGIETELASLGIKYDISRRISRNNIWLPYTATAAQTQVTAYPAQTEEGNDDFECFCPMGPSDRIDEDAIPTANEIFDYDAPSETALFSARAFSIRRLNFEDFARVSFGIDIAGNIQEGSKCSQNYNWDLEYSLISNSTINNNDPYDMNSQLLRQTNGGAVMASNPRRLIGSGNGPIVLNAIVSSPVLTYILEFNPTANQWILYERAVGGTNPVAMSAVNNIGPWIINYGTVNVNITNGLTPFTAGSTFVFNIWDVPMTANSMTAN